MDFFYKFLEPDNILSDSRIPLFKLQKLDLFLPMHIFWKVPLHKFSFEYNPSDFIACSHQSMTHIIPPIISFLYQHMHSKWHLICFTTHHNPKNPFNVLHPSIHSIQIIPAFEGMWVIPLGLSQVVKLIILAILVVLHNLSHCLQSGKNNTIISPNYILNNINKYKL